MYLHRVSFLAYIATLQNAKVTLFDALNTQSDAFKTELVYAFKNNGYFSNNNLIAISFVKQPSNLNDFYCGFFLAVSCPRPASRNIAFHNSSYLGRN